MKKILLLILIAMSLCGCRTIRYVPVETIRTDSLYINKVMHDSTIIKDSIIIREKGDTVYQYLYKYIYRDRAVHDTTYVERTDTIRVPYPVEVQPSTRKVIKSNFAAYLIIMIILLFTYIFCKFVRSKK